MEMALYRVPTDRKVYKTLRGAKMRAIELRGFGQETFNVVDETGAVVWSTDKLPIITVGRIVTH
jgi:hypothetical protein